MGNAAPNPFQSARFLTSCADLVRLPPPLPEVAFAGRSNAGKSSALNVICAQKQLARVSKTPGRTQLLNFFDVPALQARLVDLPGYGYARVPDSVRRNWGLLVGGFLERREGLRGIVLVMDIRHPLTAEDQQMLDWSAAQGLALHILLTKSDKLGFGAAKDTWMRLQKDLGPGTTAQLFSAQTLAGVPEARALVARWLQPGGTDA